MHLRGVLAIEAGAPDDAVGYLRRALTVRPDYPEAHLNLGHALHDLGRPQDALPALREAIRLAPQLATAHNSLGLAFQSLGQPQAARAAHQRALTLLPDYPEAWTNLGNALGAQGQLENAMAAHRRAIALRPDYALAYANLGTVLRAAGRLEDAIAAWRAAVARAPALAAVHNDLGTALREIGRPGEALTAFDQALALAPADAGAHYNRGVALSDLDHLDDAAAALGRAVELDGSRAGPHFALGNIRRDLGALRAAVDAFRTAVRLDPEFGNAWSNLLFLLNCLPGESDESLVRANGEWAKTVEDPAPPPPAATALIRERRLRIGYVSTEFRRHHFLAEFLPVLRAHDRREFEIVCYADVAAPDRDTELVASLADSFRNLHGLADATETLRADGIDILVSLTGYLANDRRLFVRRTAPVQATYINHLTATGLRSIDYRITDLWLDPPGAVPALDSECPVRLESGFSCYAQPTDAPEPTPPPALQTGAVTFGSFNALIKVTDETLALWAELLARVPRSRLLIKARELSRPAVLAAFQTRLAAAGLDRRSCDLMGYVANRADNLAVYAQVDIGLDPMPFAGGATTREMLWMGLPVVTLAGSTRASRIGASLLTRAGLASLVATTPKDYIGIAADLAADVAGLAARRAGQRQRLLASPLLDAGRHTRELEAAYRQMWKIWCAAAPDSAGSSR